MCCCNWGCAVKDEWPEFECAKCPIHRQAFGFVADMCKRHRQEALAKR